VHAANAIDNGLTIAANGGKMVGRRKRLWIR
jgi:hypothetical protein